MVLYVFATVVLLVIFPIAEYVTKARKWRRILLGIHILFALIVIGFTVSNEITSSRMETEMEALKTYSSVAKWDALGYEMPFREGQQIEYTSPLSRMLENMYTKNEDGDYDFRLDEEAEQQYQVIVDKYPKYPFGYYYLAMCQRERGNSTWVDNAQKAISILEQTIIIEDHHRHHDEVLEKLRSYEEL